MAKESSKMQSWQVFHYARKHLGRSILYAIFGKKNARTVNFWCENPRFTSKPEDAYDPIAGVKALLTTLDDLGHTDVVRSAIHYILSETTLADSNNPNLKDLLPTLAEEQLADFVEVGNLHRAIGSDADIEDVLIARDDAIAEIERTVALYIKEQSES